MIRDRVSELVCLKDSDRCKTFDNLKNKTKQHTLGRGQLAAGVI
jgi:hypothetical protein